MKRLILFCVLVGISDVSMASNYINRVPAAPCTIFIRSFKNNGERVLLKFTTKLRSRAECVSLAQLHFPNYDTDKVRRKKIIYAWNYKRPILRTVKKSKRVARRFGR